MLKIDGITAYTKHPTKKDYVVFSADVIEAILQCELMEYDKAKGEPICPCYSKNCGLVFADGNCRINIERSTQND